MLKKFVVSNVLSFGEKTEFVFDGKSGISAVCGENAVGKSNLVKAMRMMRNIVLTSSTIPYVDDYCRAGNNNNKEKPSHFEMEIENDGFGCTYEFDVVLSSNIFVYEHMKVKEYNHPEGTLFERDKKHININEKIVYETETMKRLKLYYDDTDCHHLYLQQLNTGRLSMYDDNLYNADLFCDFFDWISESFVFICPDDVYQIYQLPMEDSVLNLIRFFDLNIDDFAYEKIPVDVMLSSISSERERKKATETIRNTYTGYDYYGDIAPTYLFLKGKYIYIIKVDYDEKKEINTDECFMIKFKHGDMTLSLYQESDGLKHLTNLLEPLLSDKEKTFIADDFDMNLHPLLADKYIEKLKKWNNYKINQLIAVCHRDSYQNIKENEKITLKRDETGCSAIVSEKQKK